MVFVTGATGILGRVIVLELLKKGKNVRAAKRAISNLDDVRHSYSFYTENPEGFFNKIEWVNVALVKGPKTNILQDFDGMTYGIRRVFNIKETNNHVNTNCHKVNKEHRMNCQYCHTFQVATQLA